MTRKETLRAILSVRENLRSTFERIGEVIQDAASELVEVAVASEGAGESLENAGDAAAVAAVQNHAAAQGYDHLAEAAQDSIAPMLATASAMDSADDQADDLMASLLGVSSALGTASVSASAAGLSFGTLEASTASLLGVAAAVTSVYATLAATLGTVAVAAAGVGAAFTALLAGGLMAMGQQAAAQQEDIKSTLEGVQHVLSQIGDQVAGIFEPLATSANAELFKSVLAAGLTILEDFVTLVQNLRPALMPVADAIGQAFAESEPEFFAQLEKLIRTTLPYLEQLTIFLMQSVPDALRFLRQNVAPLIPVVGDFAMAMLNLAVPLLEVATLIGGVLIPVLTPFIDFLAGVAEGAAFALSPLLYLAQALGAVSQALGPLSEAIGVVVGALGTMLVASSVASSLAGLASVISLSLIPSVSTLITVLSPLLGPAGLLAGAVVVVGALIEHFGLLEDVTGILKSAFNELKPVLRDVSQELASIIKQATVAANKVADVKTDDGQKGLGTVIMETAVRSIGSPGGIGTAAARTLFGDDSGGSGSSGGGDSSSGGGSGAAKRPSSSTSYRDEVNVNLDLSGAELGRRSEEEIRRLAKEAVREANREKRRQSGHPS